MGDWIGREAKGGQAWLTYHLSGNEWVQLEYLNKKIPKDFDSRRYDAEPVQGERVKRFGRDVEVNAWVQYEAGRLRSTSRDCKGYGRGRKLTWYPKWYPPAGPVDAADGDSLRIGRRKASRDADAAQLWK